MADQQQQQQQQPQQTQQQRPPQQGGYMQHVNNGEPEALRNLIVNYIPTTVDENQLRQLFEHYGPIESAKIVTNRETKQSRGFGFIKYQYAMSAYNAINCLNSYPLMNKRLKVAYAKEQEAIQAQTQMQMYNPMMMGMQMGMQGMQGMYGMGGIQQQQQQRRPPRQQGQGQQQGHPQQHQQQPPQAQVAAAQ